MTTSQSTTILPESESTRSIWGIALYPLGCPCCTQVYLAQDPHVEQRCPSCAQAILIPQTARLRTEPPEAIIPFKLQKADLTAPLEQFAQAVWLRPDDFSGENLFQRLKAVYLPAWLVDCRLSGTWEAEAGYDYEVKSSQETYQHGQWVTTPLTEKRTRWEKRVGRLDRVYHNITAPALANSSKTLRQIGEFDSASAHPYHFEIPQDILLHVPDLPPESAWETARERFDQAAARDCLRAAAAEHIRNFSIQGNYGSQNWTQLLMPMFFTHYSDDEGRQHPVWIHGQTGHIAGAQWASQQKGWYWAGVSIATAVTLFLISLFFFAFNTVIPALLPLGFLFAVFAFAGGVFSLVPLIWPRQWNHRQKERKIFEQSKKDIPPPSAVP